jgi:hypothetical protein
MVITGCGTPSATESDSGSSASSTPVQRGHRPSRVPRSPPFLRGRARTGQLSRHHQAGDCTGCCAITSYAIGPAATSQYNQINLICPPKYFRAHLDALAEDGYTTISPGQYLRHLTTGAALPRKPVMLSFDDGSAGQAHEGLTQSEEARHDGTFFVMTVVAE